MTDNEQLNIKELKNAGVKFAEIGFLDFHGDLRSRTFPIDKLEEVLEEGYGFDGYSVGYLSIEDSDLLAVPDPSAFYIYEVNGIKIVFLHCDLYKDGKPLEIYPRYILKRIEKEAPYKALIGPEVEFYVIDKNGGKNNGFYMASHPEDSLELLKRELLLEMSKIGIEVEVMHHEVGPGQHEITLPARSPVEMADLIVFYKKFLKTFFGLRGYKVTFMPKPFEGLAGNGMHVHVSLWKDGKNLFYDDGLSEQALYFIGGLLKYAQSISVYTNPTVNSYKRLVPGFEAPVHLVWDWGNRSVLIRIPVYKKLNSRNARIEYRAPDSSGNIYLTFAAILEAGFKGINEKINPGGNFNDNAYKPEHAHRLNTLPKSLHEAIEMAKNANLMEDRVKEKFLKLKLKEWKEYEKYINGNGLDTSTLKVTEWELAKYFYR